MVATVEVELPFAARAGIEVPAHLLGAAMGDGPGGAPLGLTHGVTILSQMGGQEAAQDFNDGDGHRFSSNGLVMSNGEDLGRVVPPVPGCSAHCDG